jgi:hypothetical protein
MMKENFYKPTPSSKKSLIQFGLIDPNCNITRDGRLVLKELAEEDPSTDPKRVMMFSGVLLSSQKKNVPAWYFAEENEYITLIKEEDEPRQIWYIDDYKPRMYQFDRYYPTKKGRDWLVENAERILQHTECTDTRKEKMVLFSPIWSLAEYLTHDEEYLRKAAAARVAEIQNTNT